MDRCKYNKFVGCNAKEGCNNCEVYVVYQQGRADAFKEIAYSDDVKKEEFEILAYNKGRADAIEEVKERMQNEISFTRIQKRLMIYILDKMKGE